MYILDVVDATDLSNVERGRDLLVRGGVKDLLENPHIVKVRGGFTNLCVFPLLQKIKNSEDISQ